MPYPIRQRECCDCGKTITGRFHAVKPVRCIDCAARFAADSAREMANKSGPAYTQWLRTRGPQGRPRGSSKQGDQ